MLPCNPGGHSAYQDFFVSQFLLFYPDPFALDRATWGYIIQFWYLDLSQTDSIMRNCYSKYGPMPRHPSCMMRSYLLALKLKVTSITKWCRMMRETPLYALLSGFAFGDTPGVGTFYGFFARMWQGSSDNYSPKDRFPKLKKTPKGKKKGEKTPCDSSSAAAKLIPLLERWGRRPEHPFWLIFRLYQQQFLDVSIQKGLINPQSTALAGDGTPVRTAAQQRKKRTCDCENHDCHCKRHYSQPDCNWGWDSHRECYFFGYHLYMYAASDSANDLPVFPMLERASRHDMLSFLHSFFSMKAYLPGFHIEKLLLDSAHDAYAVYEYCQREGTVPFIDLNSGNTGNFKYKDTFTVGEDGIPVCGMGLPMRRDGCDHTRHRIKFCCPKAKRGSGGCTCESPCSESPYGRVVYLIQKDNPRMINLPPRGSAEWKKEYDARTCVERSNKREKEDYLLESGRHRSTKMWYCRLYGIMMLQHLDAWEMPSVEAFQESIFGQTA